MFARTWHNFRNRIKRKAIYSRPEFWDSKALDYQDSAISMFTNRRLNVLLERDQFAFIDRVLPDLTGAVVLDVGAGTGRLSRHMARRGAEVVSFDFAPAVVEIARRINADLPIQASVLSVFDLQAEAAYDHAAVLGCLSAACVDADALGDAMLRLHRALRPGASVAMVEPFHTGFLHRVLDLSLPDALRVIEASGFTVTHVEEMHFWPVRLFIAPVEWPDLLTRAAHSGGEALLRLAGARFGLGDYKGIGLVRRDST